MKKEKSTLGIVTFHIMTTAVIFPFFGLMIGYFVWKYLGNTFNSGALTLLRDVINVGFFLLGMKYSLSYIDKNMIAQNPKSCSKRSILIFTILVIYVWSVHLLNSPNTIAIIYNTIFYGIIFLIFFVMTRQYFSKLSNESR
ncbi:MAG: hypothetical protein R3331_02550 [Sulfurospirillaceae bacterium]|nr:hypothetical protein [Sulfurospirillaceae bacterium]